MVAVNKIDRGQFLIFHSDSFNGAIELFFTSDIDTNYNDIIKENQCYIILKDFNANNIRVVFDEVIKTLKRNGFDNIKKSINIIVHSKEENDLVENIVLGDEFEIVIIKEYEDIKEVDNTKSDKTNKKEKKTEELIEKFLSYNTIIKVDNGIRRSFVQRIADDANNSYMLEDVSVKDIYDKYMEMLNNNDFKEKIANMNSNDIVNEILDALSVDGNKKRYYLESSLEQSSFDKRGNVAGDIAYQSGGVVNKEQGIVNNGVDSSQRYTVVEEDNQHLNAVSPEVQQTIIGNNGNVSSDLMDSYDVKDDFNNDKDDFVKDEEGVQSRKINNDKVKKRILEKPNSVGIVSILEIGFIFLLLSLVIMFFIFNR